MDADVDLAEESMAGDGARPSVDLDEYKMMPVAIPHFQKKLRLPKIFNYYYILDTVDPAGKSLRAMCKTCETTICYSRRATSNLITHLKRKHPMIYADYAELQSPSFMSSSPQGSYISQAPTADNRGEQIILQIQDTPTQMIDLTKQQASMNQPENYSYGTSSDTEVMDLTGMNYQPPASYQNSTLPHHYHNKRKTYRSSHITSTATAHPMADSQPRDVAPTAGSNLNPQEWFLLFMADTMLPTSVVTNPYLKGFLACLNNKFILPSEEALNHEWIPSRQESIRINISRQLEEVERTCIHVSKHQQTPERHVVNFSACFIEQWKFQRVLLACKIFKHNPLREMVDGIIDELKTEFKLDGKVTQMVMDEDSGKGGDFNLPGFSEDHGDSEQAEGGPEEKPLIGESPDPDTADGWLALFEQDLQSCIGDGLQDIQEIANCITKVVSISRELGNGSIDSPGDDGHVPSGWLQQIKVLKVTINSCNNDTSQETTLSEVEKHLLDELFDILEPFEDAMDYISKHKEDISISFVVPCIRGLQRHLQTNNPSSCQRLLFQLKAALIKHLSKYESSEVCQLAASLDPRFKLAWCSEQENGPVKGLLLRESIETAQECLIYRVDFSPQMDEEGRNTSKLFKLMESPQQSRPNFQEAKVQEEVTNYLSLPCSKNTIDPLQYWKGHTIEFPTLSRLASRILCIPAATSSSNTMQERNAANSPSWEIAESLMFIRNNSSLL